MYLEKINILNFRNYRKLELQFKPGISLFKGENGQGKSNFLEAVYCLCFGRSSRPVQDADMVNWDRSYFYLQGIIHHNNSRYHMEVGYEPAGSRKVIKINGVKEKKGSLQRNFPVVLFVPEDLEIVRRGPEERRRFLDRELCQASAAYTADLSAYNRALAQKNRLLKEKLPSVTLRELLQPWEKQLIQHGSRIICRRIAAVHNWHRLATVNYNVLFDGLQKLTIHYLSSIVPPDFCSDGESAFQEISENMSGQMKLREAEERARGHALVGPHKDDLIFMIDRREAKKFASHGQQRSAVIALKAAQVQHFSETVEKPLFIIDDIFSELDEQRRRQCLLLFNAANQVFMTVADGQHLMDYQNAKQKITSFFDLGQGKIKEFTHGD